MSSRRVVECGRRSRNGRHHIGEGAGGVGVSLLVAYQVRSVWPPSTPEYIIAGAIGLLLGYAAGLTALLREAIRGVKTVERDVATGVEQVEERITQA